MADDVAEGPQAPDPEEAERPDAPAGGEGESPGASPPPGPEAEPEPGAEGEGGTGAGEPGEAEPGDDEGPGDEEGGKAGKAKAAADREPPPAPPPPERLEGAIEALLLAGGEALSPERIRDVLGLPSVVHVREALAAIRTRWAGCSLAVELQDVAGGHRVVTRPEYAEYVRRLSRRPAADRLTQPLLETLSIVAYRQPVARAEIERIRGVQAGDALRGLLERRLVKVAGRSDQPGRPLLYGTTHRFLEVFGLASLQDLPSAKDLQRL